MPGGRISGQGGGGKRGVAEPFVKREGGAGAHGRQRSPGVVEAEAAHLDHQPGLDRAPQGRHRVTEGAGARAASTHVLVSAKCGGPKLQEGCKVRLWAAESICGLQLEVVWS
jgi:hypothetical protein